jgi:phosphoribosylformylglycinamidine synthase subunit PurQ / glutaminase
MIKFAVISFPGTNCETESVRAFKRNGMDAETVLWNDPGLLNGSRCAEFDGYCIPGGFSYEDRGRSGVVAAQDPVMKMIGKEADTGKVVIGICNGAQILVETGLIPGFDGHPLASALTWNEMRVGDKIVDTGFYSAWSYLKNSAPRGRTAFNDFDELQHVPFAHGEGRYMMSPETLKKLEENNQIVFKYCDSDGNVNPDFPITPNGAMASIAGLCNPAGNVMAIMPHPERDPLGRNSNLIFQSIKKWIEKDKKTEYKALGAYPLKEDVRKLEAPDVEIFVRLIITDNTERTIEEALVRSGYKMHLDRYDYYGIRLEKGILAEDAVRQIMATGELANFNKHLVFVRTKQGLFSYGPTDGLKASQRKFSHMLVAADRKDFVGLSKQSAINSHAGKIIESLQYGVLWDVSGVDENMVKKIIDSKVLYNPHSMYLMHA